MAISPNIKEEFKKVHKKLAEIGFKADCISNDMEKLREQIGDETLSGIKDEIINEIRKTNPNP